MAKYSTGSSSGSGGESCELCGDATDSLTDANIAGAQLQVCSSCASHNDNAHADEKKEENVTEQDRKRQAAQNTAKLRDRAGGDSTHWEEDGANYDDDQLPYLVSGYGERVEAARQEAGLQRGELADELDVSENDLLAVEQSRAIQADIGGALIESLEKRLDVQLAE